MYRSKKNIMYFGVILLFIVMFLGCSQSDEPTRTDLQDIGSPDNTKPATVDDRNTSSNHTGDSLEMDSWLGSYHFSEVLSPLSEVVNDQEQDKLAEGVVPDQQIEYDISIWKEGTIYDAKITIDGFQTKKELQASISGDENFIQFLFKKNLSDNTVEPYEQGELLLRFEKKASKMYTAWKGMQPANKMNDKTGVYFTKKEVITYVNQESGFAIDFPKSWEGYYTIRAYEKGIGVYFIGKSKASKGFNEETGSEDGLFMFNISAEFHVDEENELMFTDSLTKLGSVRGFDYYYSTSTDASLGALGDITNEEQEQNLQVKDYEKAMEMQKDIWDILTTFRSHP